MRKNVVLAVVVSACLLGILYAAWSFDLVGRLSDYGQLVETMRGDGLWSPLVCIGVQFLQVVIFVIPGEITQIAAGYVFGAWLGFVYSLVGIALGSMFDFWFARLVGRPVVERIMGRERLQRIDELLRSRKGRSALFVLFLIPGMPKDAMSYGAGLTQLGMGEFVVVSGLARTPALLFSTLMGSQLYERDYSAMIITAVIGVAVAGGFYWYQRKYSFV
ncbi:MAG: VTT domain-containing protein [Acidobacteria bacterium]|nr:VTT domain-containing protein [Acidobacteriota bacterium]